MEYSYLDFIYDIQKELITILENKFSDKITFPNNIDFIQSKLILFTYYKEYDDINHNKDAEKTWFDTVKYFKDYVHKKNESLSLTNNVLCLVFLENTLIDSKGDLIIFNPRFNEIIFSNSAEKTLRGYHLDIRVLPECVTVSMVKYTEQGGYTMAVLTIAIKSFF